jgi:hypothetical protein
MIFSDPFVWVQRVKPSIHFIMSSIAVRRHLAVWRRILELELFQSIFCFFNSCRLKMIGKICEGERIVLVDRDERIVNKGCFVCDDSLKVRGPFFRRLQFLRRQFPDLHELCVFADKPRLQSCSHFNFLRPERNERLCPKWNARD